MLEWKFLQVHVRLWEGSGYRTDLHFHVQGVLQRDLLHADCSGGVKPDSQT